MSNIRSIGTPQTVSVQESTTVEFHNEDEPSGTTRPNSSDTESRISERDASHRRFEHTISGRIVEGQLRNSSSPTVEDVLGQGRRAGLNQNEINSFRAELDRIPSERRTEEMNFLSSHVTRGPNAGRAIRTYMELRNLQQRYPSRITDDIVHTLARGVAERRTGARAGMEGVMGRQQAIDSAITLTLMPEEDYSRMRGLLNQAGQSNGHPVAGASPQLERALLLKSLGARVDSLHTGAVDNFLRDGSMSRPQGYMDEIESYASQIRGTRRADLLRRSTLVDVDSDSSNEAQRQRFSTSCTITVAQIARAEADPIFAWRAHQNPEMVLAEQEGRLNAHGGNAVQHGQNGGRGLSNATPAYNELISPYTGQRYAHQDIANSSAARLAAVNQIETVLRRGVDVPIRIQWDGGNAHAVLATDVRGRPGDREFLITDPFTGTSAWHTEANLTSGETEFEGTGTGRLSRLYLNR